MKAAGVCPLLLWCLCGLASASSGQATPITRVVKLLQGLALKTKLEGKKEEDLFDNFVCWAKSVMSQKTASNQEANARISTLETYIADIEAGRVEFTTERADLEKELADLTREIESASALRDREHEEFLDAESDMNKAISALDKAIEVLKDASEGHLEGTFLVQGRQGFLARSREAASLAHAVELGERVLSAGDAVFLRRLLTGDVPEVDWTKLNREATFKKSYKARSLDIQATLAKLKSTFSENLKSAQEKEVASKALFDKLMETQLEQKSKTEEAYRKLDVENGAKGLAKSDAQAEVDALKEQVENDEIFIAQTKASLQEKKEEWADRSTLRAAEIATFSKAIEILNNDDARDLLKRSYASQGYSLLQESQQQQAARRLNSTAAALRRAAEASKDGRLTALALRVAMESGSHFKAVVKAIDTLVSDLEAEEREDLSKKEQCEENRANDARAAVLASRSVDEHTDTISRLAQEIHEIELTKAEKEASAAHAKEQLAEATKLRTEEHGEFVQSQADDKEAAATVQRAIEVLKNFYAENKLVLAQQPAQAAAGQAPPPPPTTWEAPYGGKTKVAGSVIDTLETAVADITKDSSKAASDETKAQALYDQLKADTEKLVAALESSITELAGVKGDKEKESAETTVSRSDKGGELQAIVARIKNAEAGCDFVTINFPVRLRNRQIEIDGLQKAKTILGGGQFNEVDPNRAIRPGDALLQQRHR